MPEETELIDINKLKERINKGIDYLDKIKPSRYGKVEKDNFYIFLGLVETYAKGRINSVRINKGLEYFRKIDPQKFNIATWFYVLHFVRLLRKYLNGEDIGTLVPVQLDNFEFAQELFDTPPETVQATV